MVLCEWPLGRNLDEAFAMAAHARRVGVKNIVGLQMRCAPTVRYMADLIADGFIGGVLSATLVGSGALWDAVMDNDHEYAASRSNGATLLSIPCAHTLDGLCALLGEFGSVQALEAQRRTTTTIRQTERVIPLDAPDQVLFSGVLESGVPVSVHYRGGIRGGTKLLMEINGTRGTLRVTGDSGGGQTANLTLEGCGNDATALQPMPTPDRYGNFPGLPGRVMALANAYARLVGDLRDGTGLSADFEHAVRRHRLLEAIEESSRTGVRVRLWP
jgi:predicted dehydrogenase